MQTTARRLRRRLAFLVVGVAAFLAVAGSAMAAPTAPAGPSRLRAEPDERCRCVTFTWTAATTADLGSAISRYQWYSSTVRPRRPGSVGELRVRSHDSARCTGADGTHSFKVRAV